MNVYLNVFLRGLFAWMLAVIDGGVFFASLVSTGPSGPEGVAAIALGMYGMLAFGTFPSLFAVLAALCAPRVLLVQMLAVAIVGFGAWFPLGWMVIHRTGGVSVTMGGLLGGVHVAFFAVALLTRRELWVWRGRARHREHSTPDIRLTQSGASAGCALPMPGGRGTFRTWRLGANHGGGFGHWCCGASPARLRRSSCRQW